ncbi:MAG TPA: c-type cytochrome [Candidatus Binatia bacterium]|nr:c-type cytochrome [Candidatus Binatia bacterium]
MTRRRLIAVQSIARRALLVPLVALAACASGRPAGLGGDPAAAGGAIYRRACASCHGLDARGDGAVAAALRVPPPDLTRLAARNAGTFPRARVLDVITGRAPLAAHGTREMPVWNERFGPGAGHVASFWARRRDELLADYLASVQRE